MMRACCVALAVLLHGAVAVTGILLLEPDPVPVVALPPAPCETVQVRLRRGAAAEEPAQPVAEAAEPAALVAPEARSVPKSPRPDARLPEATARRSASMPPRPKASAGGERDELAAVEVHTPEPVYPDKARKRGQEGSVVVEFTIGTDGACSEIRVAESSGYRLLDEAAVAAVGKWRFQPAKSGGRTISSIRRVRFTFRLQPH